ncbi:Protein disulfide-isomerase [Monocercomonoides exilis]|uniref:Protein disulfide-isomerase n=1 Tax=Monocercomonoides exilis TaxID=2049356 RepID=UPI00355A9E67|nr:Protein disulfide-isomerase [Monocercomonoides exilis]|eukprot:MONOS_13209.1-p1 / transcript=MONOS_13209.1 / gene=MONOS_13209 / organism=Monocercomonoides_exilis_PA203 / gene_product=Protein disulfide-isomerase / transcript_product=Protein disulfide-isomerase / location=Mono_scaffold00792:558-2809(+) / protein_length=676 / sequence_SO=supercontig / SO=protein_coding / is_pseudo=false
MILHFILTISFFQTCISKDVVQLSFQNFSSVISTGPTMVLFYTTWCPYCKQFIPEYEKASTLINDTSVTLARVNCEVEKDLNGIYVKSGYPTVLFFHCTEFIAFNSTFSHPSAAVRIAVIDPLLQKSSLVVHHGFDNISEHFQSSEKDGKWNENELLSFEKEHVRPLIYEGDPSFMFYSHFPEENSPSYIGYLFVYSPPSHQPSSSTPSTSEPNILSSTASQDLPNPFFTKFRSMLLPFAEKYRKNISFHIVEREKFSGYGATLGVSGSELPTFVIEKVTKVVDEAAEWEQRRKMLRSGRARIQIHPSSRNVHIGQRKDSKTDPPLLRLQPLLHYICPIEGAQLDGNAIGKFIESVLSNQVKPNITSDSLSETERSPFSYAMKLTGNNFIKEVINSSNDVFVRFTSPNCRMCVRNEPLFYRIATDLHNWNAGKNNKCRNQNFTKSTADHLVIAEMDMSRNTLPVETPVLTDLPALYLFTTANKSNPIKCDVWHSTEQMKQFLSEHLDATYNKGEQKKSPLLFPLHVNKKVIEMEKEVDAFDNEAERMTRYPPVRRGSDHPLYPINTYPSPHPRPGQLTPVASLRIPSFDYSTIRPSKNPADSTYSPEASEKSAHKNDIEKNVKETKQLTNDKNDLNATIPNSSQEKSAKTQTKNVASDDSIILEKGKNSEVKVDL